MEARWGIAFAPWGGLNAAPELRHADCNISTIKNVCAILAACARSGRPLGEPHRLVARPLRRLTASKKVQFGSFDPLSP